MNKREQKKVTTGIPCFLGSLLFSFLMWGQAKEESGAWWFGFAVFIILAVFSLPMTIVANGKVKKINQEIENYKKQIKNLENSIR